MIVDRMKLAPMTAMVTVDAFSPRSADATLDSEAIPANVLVCHRHNSMTLHLVFSSVL